jgi:hypothetical protein
MWLQIEGGDSVSAHRCCQSPSRSRRVREVAGWLVPGALLALLPKCPMCVAAYIALGTGISMSYASAHMVLRMVTVICIGALAWCAVRLVAGYCRQ